MAAHRKTIIISSVRNEFQTERLAIRDFVHNNPLLRRFFHVFLFEDLPAQGRQADDIYLAEVCRSDIYVGLCNTLDMIEGCKTAYLTVCNNRVKLKKTGKEDTTVA